MSAVTPPPTLDCHTLHIACKFSEIRAKVYRRSGKATAENSDICSVFGAANTCIVFGKQSELPRPGHLLVVSPLGKFYVG